MLSMTLNIAIAAVLVAMLLALWRLIGGPRSEDLILALDTLYIDTIALVLMLSIRFDTRIYFEAALLIAMTGFVGTIALAKYLLRANVMD
jgi:multicomponent K+:H+ antiporter subunit F